VPLDATDRRLLNLIQSDFPLCREPFVALAASLDVAEDDVRIRIQRLKDKRIVRSISGVFNASGLGYHSTLVAMHVDPARVEQAAELINGHRGVSHNYLRDHYLNLWFTLTMTKGNDLEAAAAELGEEAKAELTLSLPTRQSFKINVCFDMVGQDRTLGNGDEVHFGPVDGDEVKDGEVAVVQELQRDLPLESRPFDAMAGRTGVDGDEFLRIATSFRDRGIMRRYGARLDHYRAGFVTNALSCWKVEPARVEEVGRTLASHQCVSHCYERRTAPQWQYNVYAMIHGHSQDEPPSIARRLSEETGVADYLILPSTREFLKRKMEYFPD
jgi:DNA-binding Lrp family transcriptional regulator